MASNGRIGLRSGSPSFLIIGLSLVIVVLLYSYWSVSSRNNNLLRDQSMLQDKVRSLSSQKIKVEQKYSAARAQVTDVERTKRKLEEKDVSSQNQKSQLESQIKRLEGELRVEKQKFLKATNDADNNENNLQKLKSEIEETNKKFKNMNVKAGSLILVHRKQKDQIKKLTHELMQIRTDRDLLKVQLDQARGESKSKHSVETKPKEKNEASPSGTPRKSVPGQLNLTTKPPLAVIKQSNRSEITSSPSLADAQGSKSVHTKSTENPLLTEKDKDNSQNDSENDKGHNDVTNDDNHDPKSVRQRMFERNMKKSVFGKQENQQGAEPV